MADAKTQSQRMPLHILYYLLYLLGVFCGLWQHGHPILTLTLIAVAIPAGLVAYIPRRFIHSEVRLICQYLVMSCALAWAIYRFGTGPPLDLLLIETFAIMGLSFAFTLPREGYYYLLMISVVLLFYGSLSPAREIYLWCMPVGVVICLMLLYQTRVASLANRSEVETRETVTWRNWPWLVVHAGLVLGIWGLLVVVYPSPQGRTTGVSPSSFETRNRVTLPPKLEQWFKSPHQQEGKDGRELRDGSRPDELSERARMKVPAGGGKKMDSFGAGAGMPGKDLVMRVRSPVKLYWLGKLYDVYDGQVWKQSRQLQRQRVPRSALEQQSAKTVRQNVQIEKWVSPTLFCSYLRISHITPADLTRIRLTFEGGALADADELQPIPFNYEVTSIIDFHLNTGSKNAKYAGWYEDLAPEHYLELPMKEISQRVRDLAFQIAGDKTDPLEKAYALRDYLRSHYTYELGGPKPPEGREPVDWFLFEHRKGHCEYYAASLTVLARLSGLPARVATGFSPGNYNVLTGAFEVYEYHAHAWTQIYVSGMGWLTMDGTPPGSTPVQSRTTPMMIGDLRDPFSDEWQIQTPELSSDTQAYIKKNLGRERSEGAGEAGQAGTAAQGKGDSLVGRLMQQLRGNREPGSREDGPMAAVETIGMNIQALFSRLGENLVAAWKWLKEMALSWQVLVVLVVLVVLRLAWPRVRRQVETWHRRRSCERWFSEAAAQRDSRPDGCILSCYRTVSGLLELAGTPRVPSKDLEDYLSEDVPEDARQAAAAVFTAYVKLQYTLEPATRSDALKAFNSTEELRRHLKARIEGR